MFPGLAGEGLGPSWLRGEIWDIKGALERNIFIIFAMFRKEELLRRQKCCYSPFESIKKLRGQRKSLPRVTLLLLVWAITVTQTWHPK